MTHIATLLYGQDPAGRRERNLLANLGHPLRTPLNQILGYTEILQDMSPGELNDRQQKFLARVQTAGNELLEIVNDLVELAQIASGKIQLELSESDLGPILHVALDGYRAKAQRLVQVDIQQGTSRIRCDEELMVRLLTCLVTSVAAMSTPSAETTVRVSLGRNDRDEAEVCVSVAAGADAMSCQVDQSGVAELDQLAVALERRCYGAGVKLALAATIAERHAYSLCVESQAGDSGAPSFSLTIPTTTVVTTQKPVRVLEPV